MKIAVLDNINLLPEAVSKIEKLFNQKLEIPKEVEVAEKQLIKRTGNAEIILINPWSKITKNYLESCPSVQYICLCGTSTKNIDLEEIKKRNITLANVRNHGDEPAAEFAFMYLLMLARGEGKYHWKKSPTELMNKSIGILGLGALGQSVANLALGFKMKVYYYSLHRNTDFEEKGVNYLELNQLLKTCDVIIITTPTNIKILNEKEFNSIKPSSTLVHLSAGEALDKEAFLKWISRDNNFAIFNMSTGENYYQSFKNLPNVIFPKIIAGYTLETKERLGQKVFENLENYLKTPPRQ